MLLFYAGYFWRLLSIHSLSIHIHIVTRGINLYKQLSWLKLCEMNIKLNLIWISFRYSNKLKLWIVHLWNKLFYMGVKWLFTMSKLWSLIHTCVTTRSSIIQESEKLATVPTELLLHWDFSLFQNHISSVMPALYVCVKR